jgi:hypothetical protein
MKIIRGWRVKERGVQEDGRILSGGSANMCCLLHGPPEDCVCRCGDAELQLTKIGFSQCGLRSYPVDQNHRDGTQEFTTKSAQPRWC